MRVKSEILGLEIANVSMYLYRAKTQGPAVMMGRAHLMRAGGAPTRSMLLSDWSTYRGLI